MPAPDRRSLGLRPEKIVETIATLQQRITERFPNAGLRLVAQDLHALSKDAIVRADRIRRPNLLLRLFSSLLVLSILALLVWVGTSVRLNHELLEFEHFVQSLESTLGSVVFIGAAIVFLMTVEIRIKRSRALEAVHELRSLAHIVDMHQLTKDPEIITGRGPATPSSPRRTMTPFELGRYLDYCSELLSLISKVGALYVQEFTDPIAVEAVDELSTLTNGLARNIWQKIMILDHALDESRSAAPPQAGPPPAAPPANRPPTANRPAAGGPPAPPATPSS